ncbi:Uncharacterised protein [Serratia quinivorans]|uniref:hypothetical protein n=1 Tax=Serratia quinivorans TaxID=137545 RepID=UPI002177353E|nr:hypothetical protein [Serratia quinivorans]CAI0865883.1 Uncharacterised protein [Serratia quinivorans]CAI0891857.1 Uncharacterised protein [Serratia quinivorans]CAI1504487.1 Uncharacterised protein [Serratia quinivorans]CAI2050359.1 Uncharacterised protein [Serratia quinivorans]CAI2084638.1 Uncharacterised protein [Serratia quinivorans]
MNNVSAIKPSTVFTFTCNGSEYVISQKDVAYFHPSTTNEGQHFVMMQNGKQYRAENLVEITKMIGPGETISVRKKL